MELTDLSQNERYLIESMRNSTDMNYLLKTMIENYHKNEDGEDKVNVFLDMMFQNLDDFSEANLKADR